MTKLSKDNVHVQTNFCLSNKTEHVLCNPPFRFITIQPHEFAQETDRRTLIAVTLERGIHSIQGFLVSMGTALMLLLATRLARHTGKRKLQGRKKGARIEESYIGGNSQLDETTSLHK